MNFKHLHYFWVTAKAGGVMLTEFVPAQGVQGDLFSQMKATPRPTLLMNAMDSINRKIGKESIKLACEGFRRSWQMRHGIKSSSCTTKWADVPVVY